METRLLFLIARISYLNLWLRFLGDVPTKRITDIGDELDRIGKEL